MTIDNPKTLLVIAGPTAVGKTETAIAVATTLRTEIISADSRQFYREMNIGTAKPTAAQRSAVPHHLIGHLSVTDNYNISLFERDTLGLLDRLFQQVPVVVMCGGSGMYIDAVCKGIDDLPDADPSIRAELRKGYEKHGIRYLQNQLYGLDPGYYAHADLNNPQRLIRALEVCLITGMPYSSFRIRRQVVRPFRTVAVGLMTSKEELYRRINGRVDRMMEQGLLREARDLYPYRHLNALQTVGYRELFDHLDGNTSLPDAVEKIKTNTRRYAKRQLTWFRRDPGMKWFDPAARDVVNEILNSTD